MTLDNKEPFTVQAGKRYNRRNGEISGVITHKKGQKQRYHAFEDVENGYGYHVDGWTFPEPEP